METRTRNNQMIFRVTDEEHWLIQKKMQQLGTRNFNVYARKMLIHGQVIKIDFSNYHALAYEVNKIGININQIAKLANENNHISQIQITQMQKEVGDVWQLLKSSLSTQQSKNQ